MEVIVKLKKLLITILVIASGCTSTPNKSTIVPVDSTLPDYIVKERNPDPAPDWAKDFSKFKKENDGKGNYYFLGESGDVNERIAGCDIASLTAKKKISQQVAELITNKIASDKQGRLVVDPNDSNDPGIKRAFEDQLAGKSIAFLSGVKEYGTFWENRDYSKINGHKRVFNCSVVVTISEKDLQIALQKSSQKTQEVIEDPEAKTAVKEALKDIDTQFKNYSAKSF